MIILSMITPSKSEMIAGMKSSMYKEESILDRRFLDISGNSVPAVHTLVTNYRSVQEIVDLANTIRGDAAAEQVAARGSLGIKPTMIRVVGARSSASNII